MKRILILILMFVSIGGFIWAGGKKEAKQPPPTPAAESQKSKDGSGAPAAAESGKPALTPAQEKLGSLGFQLPTQPIEAPDFELNTLEGGVKSLSSYRGSVVFLNFWATWCPPCRQEMPSMEKLHQALKNESFALVAVNLQEDKQTVAQFIKENKYTYQILLDESGQVGGGLYGVEGIPTTYVIGKDGFILGRLVGTREWDGEDVLTIFKSIING